MKNSEYWKGRFELLEAASNRDAASVYHDIEGQYMAAQRQIESQIQSWYQRFAKGNKVTMAEARKMLNAKELAELKWDVKEYIKHGQQQNINPAWMQQLENASARYHISRLEALKSQTQQSMEVLFGNQTDEVDFLMRKIYSDGYYHAVYEIQKGFNVGWDIAGVDQTKLEKIISKPWAADGKNFSDRIWTNKQRLINELHTQLTQTCILGKSPDDAIKNIAKKMNTSKNNAGRLVMTESAYFSSVSQKDAFNDLDVERFEIVATLDSHTSAICQEMDGKVFPMKDHEPGVTAPPFHVWCRSCTVPYFDDNYGGERAARGEDGKAYYVPDNMNYGEWQKRFAKDAEPKPYYNMLQDEKQFEKYKAIFGKEFPNTLDKFQELKYNKSERWRVFKATKQDVFNSLAYENKFDGLFGDLEVRSWYLYNNNKIPQLINISASIKEQAMQGFKLRNKNKVDARKMMSNRTLAAELNENDPIISFSQLLRDKMERKNLSKEEAYKDILKTVTKTRKSVNDKLGL